MGSLAGVYGYRLDFLVGRRGFLIDGFCFLVSMSSLVGVYLLGFLVG